MFEGFKSRWKTQIFLLCNIIYRPRDLGVLVISVKQLLLRLLKPLKLELQLKGSLGTICWLCRSFCTGPIRNAPGKFFLLNEQQTFLSFSPWILNLIVSVKEEFQELFSFEYLNSDERNQSEVQRRRLGSLGRRGASTLLLSPHRYCQLWFLRADFCSFRHNWTFESRLQKCLHAQNDDFCLLTSKQNCKLEGWIEGSQRSKPGGQRGDVWAEEEQEWRVKYELSRFLTKGRGHCSPLWWRGPLFSQQQKSLLLPQVGLNEHRFCNLQVTNHQENREYFK